MSNASGVTYQADLPLRWRYETAPSEAALGLARHANIALLQTLTTIESAPDKEHDVDPAVAKAVDRLEAKLDIVLNLLSKLVAEQAEVPASNLVTLGVHQVEWQGASDFPALDAIILLNLYLSPKLPEPLQIYARVTTSQTNLCVAEFLDRDEELEEWITRMLFRYHRRALQARHQA